MDNRFVIDESKYKEVKNISGLTWIELDNSLGTEVDATELSSHLLTAEGIQNVNTLTICYGSSLRDVKIVKVFPNIQRLFIKGKNILSLDGLEDLKNGGSVFISVDNKKRSISGIATSSINELSLDYKKSEDFEAISNCLTLKSLEVTKSPSPNMSLWQNVPLLYLRLQGSFTELSDMSSVKTLEHVMIAYCRKFERFKGNNSMVRHLNITSCKKFDPHSLNNFESLEFINITSCAQTISLTNFPDLPNLRFLELYACKIHYDTYELSKKFPKLEAFITEDITEEKAILLSSLNGGLAVKYSNSKYINGANVDIERG